MTALDSILSAEESYLWLCARSWRKPQAANLGLLPQSTNLEKLDWDRLVSIGLHNRMQAMLDLIWTGSQLEEHIPARAAQELSRGVARFERHAANLAEALQQYLYFASERAQRVVVIKGLWLSTKIYGLASMRPGSDIDLLLSRQDIPDSIAILEEKMGYGRWWRPLLDDAYYDRHHLHQQRANHDRTIWIEPHWLLDHPYTLLTIDYEALMERATPGELLGQPVYELAAPDLLISLSVHLVKHAVYLPSTINRSDLPRLILADGMLMYFVDVAEVLAIYGDTLDWQNTVDLARQSGTAEILYSVLTVCRRYLGAAVPDQAMRALRAGALGFNNMRQFGSALPQERSASLSSPVLNRMADHIITVYQGQEPDPLWAFLLGYQESIVFRPIRLLDLLAYVFPGDDYLRRRYGRVGMFAMLNHARCAVFQYARVGLDTASFTLRRIVEVRRLDRQGYVWPELPKEPDSGPV